MLSNLQEAKARGGRVIGVATGVDAELRTLADGPGDCVIELPPVPELWSPFLTVLPLQLLAYHVAVRAGRDVDQPRNLAKSVTVE
jgi:glutamine---fructose-6-phosphate transaminase (isomerizing)